MEEQVLKRILQKPNLDVVIPGSTPVISFGDFTKARVATLGINPSSIEFLSGNSLIKDNKRLCDYEVLGINFDQPLKEIHAQAILDGCNNYFNSNPYAWFDGFNEVLEPFGASYKSGTACHLDLVQSATKPAWRDLSLDHKTKLLQQDYGFTEWQLSAENLKYVLLSGGLVKERIEKTYFFKTEIVDVIYYMSGNKKTSIQLYRAYWNANTQYLGWTVNLQQMRAEPKVKIEVKEKLTQFVREQIQT